jgi:hypothetical protein
MYVMSSRTTGGTLAAWLIIAAILGFAGGAFFGLQSGGTAEPRTQTTTPADSGSDNSSQDDEDNESPDDSSEPSDSGDPSSPSETPSGDFGIELTMAKDEVQAEEDIEFTITVDPPQEGVVMRLERRVGDGDWELFSDNVGPYTTNSSGEVSTSIWSGREGDNEFRLVDINDEGNISNVATVTITE